MLESNLKLSLYINTLHAQKYSTPTWDAYKKALDDLLIYKDNESSFNERDYMHELDKANAAWQALTPDEQERAQYCAKPFKRG